MLKPRKSTIIGGEFNLNFLFSVFKSNTDIKTVNIPAAMKIIEAHDVMKFIYLIKGAFESVLPKA